MTVSLTFGSALQRHLPGPPLAVAAGTVAEALAQAFEREPRLRGIVVLQALSGG